MTTYADPTRCPDCHAVLPPHPQTCRVCALPLSGETAAALFATFQEADCLLGVLRSQKAPVTVGGPAPSGSLLGGLSGMAPYPSPTRTAPTPGRPVPRVTGASVPKILLSLGALCLLVAAVIFLAVAWGWLGVGGRTGVLVAFTGTALGLSAAMHRRGLRMAAESLSVVGLGLLALDVVGVQHAGWLGTLDGPHLTLLAGTVVGAASLLMLVTTARRPLLAPALIAPVALLVAGVGAQWEPEAPVPMLVTAVVLLTLARVGTQLPSSPLRVASIATASVAWLAVVAGGLFQSSDPITVAHYVGDLAAWPLLAATVVAGAAGLVTGVRQVARPGYAVAGLLGTYTVLLPVLDNARTAMVVALLVASAAWVVVLLVAPASLRPPVTVPLLGTLVVPTVAALKLAQDAARSVTSAGPPFTQAAGVHVGPVTPWVSPLVLLPTLVVLAASACAVVRLAQPVARSTWVTTLSGAILLGIVLTLSSYDVPLAVVVGLVVAIGTVATLGAERVPDRVADVVRLTGLVLMTGAALLALPSDAITTGVLAVASALAGYLMLRTDTTGAVAAACFPVAFAGLVWSGANVGDVDPQVRAVPILIVLGGLAIWRPQVELEASSAFAGVAASAASIALAHDLELSLAVHLTVAGTLVTASSLVHPGRRLLAWPGGVLLAAATWVRLYDLGVHAPEAYALPSALVLVAVGVRRLRRDERSATLRCLAPGLSLATVPSLLAMLDEPYSLRALLLGVACLALTVGGVTLRWSAPLVVGGLVGAALVLRELAPYAAQVPTWTAIGVSGVALLVVGVTWESRMNDVRRASRYVAALR